MRDWYARPVLFVASVERAIAFYTERLGFTEGPRYQEEGIALVGEVSRGGCTLLLNNQQPQRNGCGRMFISLDQATLDGLRADFEARSAPVEEGWWGYDLMVIRDPDGNELFFPYP